MVLYNHQASASPHGLVEEGAILADWSWSLRLDFCTAPLIESVGCRDRDGDRALYSEALFVLPLHHVSRIVDVQLDPEAGSGGVEKADAKVVVAY